jgi:cytochrome c peroxidase
LEGSSNQSSRWPRRLSSAAFVLFLLLGGCGGEDEPDTGSEPLLPKTPYDYVTLTLPGHVQREGDHSPPDNRVTNAGATLGRVLFYERRLSRNDSTACGSCHLQERAFTDGRAHSVGFEGRTTRRNSLTLANLRFQLDHGPRPVDVDILDLGILHADGFFWDMRASTIEALALMPIQDPIEMGMSLADVPSKLERAGYYAPLFEAAFGDSHITTDRVARALAQFVRSIVSGHSRYDDALASNGESSFEDFASFTAQENSGKRLFFLAGRCQFCHSEAVSISSGAFNNGLDLETTDPGVGAFRPVPDPASGLNRTDALFKAPSLRNIELTAPYMHDGRFATLDDVVEHYNSRIQPHRNLSFVLRGLGANNPRRLNFDKGEKLALVAFLKTLTDNNLVTDPKFSDPFPR